MKPIRVGVGLLGVGLGVAFVLWSCGSARPKAHELAVTSYSPTEAVETPEAIEIQFDRPVVDAQLVGRPPDPAWVTIEPQVAWTGHWRDRQTLVIAPSTDLAPATTYKVSLAGALRARTGGFTFQFVHQPLEVDGVFGVDTESLEPDGEIPISFNQPVRAKDAAARCTLVPEKGAPVALTTKTPDKVDTTIALVPAKLLPPGASYELTCEKLTAATGDAPLVDAYRQSLRARPPLSVVGVSPSGVDIPADEVSIELELSTDVALDDVRKAISSTPAIDGLDKGWLDGSGRRYRVSVDLLENTHYDITLANLADRYGQKLVAPGKVSFQTGLSRSRLQMEAGIFALEASAPGYPIWTRNITRYEVECAAIPRAKLVRLLTTEMNYDPWGGSNDSAKIEWKKLGASVKKKTVAVTAAHNTWHHDDLDLGATCGRTAGARGVYLADVSSTEVTLDPDRPWANPNRRRVLANVTDLGVMIKVGPASGIVWVTSLASGDPTPGAKVTVFTPEGKQVASGTTDKDGLVKIPGSALAKAQPSVDDSDAAGEEGGEEWEDWDSYRSQRLIAIVEKANDLAVVDGNWANGIQIWNFSLPEERRGGQTKIKGFIQSDRGLYRPGESVHFKGLVREVTQTAPPRVPKDKRVSIEVSDSRGTSIHSDVVSLSSFGGFHFDLALDKEASLGDYYVKATLGGQVFRERFMVEEYRPAAFELAIEPGATPRPGGRMTFKANARYLFGAPVTDATVEWNVRRRSHVVSFPKFEEYSFELRDGAWWYRDDYYDDYGTFVADGTGETDANGNLSIAARDTERPIDAGPQDYIVSVNVTDDTDQTIGKSTVVTAHAQDLYLGIHAQEYVQAVNMPFGVNLIAVDTDGKRIAATAKLQFIRDESRCNWYDYGRRSRQVCDEQKVVAFEKQVQIAATGTTTERIYPKDPGEYMVRVETTDARGNVVVTGEPIWVLGKGQAFWSGDESARMTLIASRPSYVPGDTAKLVAQANLERPTALITIERDGVMRAYTRKLESPNEGIELAIEDAWAPNVYASVVLVQGRRGPGDKQRPQMKMGVVELKVSTEHKALAVGIELDKDTVKPGETVTGRIRVTAGGLPVKSEVAVSVADEGVLQLIAYQTPNPLTTFYASTGLGVDTGTNLNRIAKVAGPDQSDPDEGGDFASSSSGKIRSRFVSSAFWAPALVTDAQGEATFTFIAPDNLTAFRVMAVAADAKDRFGSGDKRLTVRKQLMARPALPRFLGAGDATTIGLAIHNDTDKPGVAKVTASASGVTLDKHTATVDVPASGVARVAFSASAAELGSATFDFTVAMNGDDDAVRVTVPIVRPRIIESRTVAKGVLDAGGRTQVTLDLGAGTLRDESELIVTIDRTGLGDLEPSLRYLVEYPYGCLEQTLSKFVPLAKAKDLSKSLGIAGLDGTKMEAYLKAGVAKVARHQQGDGHFSLWPQSQTHPHLTVLAIWGLDEARKAGVAVPEETIDRGIAALQQWVTETTATPDGEGATLAMTGYLLATHGVPDQGLQARLYQQRAGLPTWGQAFLLRAMIAAKADAKQIADLEGVMVKSLVQKGDALVAPDDHDHYYMSSDARSTAMALSALIELSAKNANIGKLVGGLDALRRPDGRWYTTEDNMWSLIALADYVRTATAGNTTVTVAAGGTTLGQPKVSGAGVAVTRTKLSALGATTIDLAATGDTHYAVRVVEARRDDGVALSKGFSVTRTYLDDAGKPLTSIKTGDLVTVKLTITAAQPQRWVAMVDPLPAGLEVVNPRLASSVDTSRDPSAGVDHVDPWSGVDWVHQEMHDDHVEWFADEMPDGTFTLAYKARAATAGTFTALPARIEAMYDPDVMGRTGSSKVTIAP
jgi:uncharacterized protein YfaS (alpha-2-macroglobulin family)